MIIEMKISTFAAIRPNGGEHGEVEPRDERQRAHQRDQGAGGGAAAEEVTAEDERAEHDDQQWRGGIEDRPVGRKRVLQAPVLQGVVQSTAEQPEHDDRSPLPREQTAGGPPARPDDRHAAARARSPSARK